MDLHDWVSASYLDADVQFSLREAAAARPDGCVAILDRVFLPECFASMAEYHKKLAFRDDLDRHGARGESLPYDAGMKPMDSRDIGSDVLLSEEFARFCANAVGIKLSRPRSVVKLRRHRPHADGFWIHTDAARYCMAVLGYYNKQWRHTDGGLLQLWRAEKCHQPGTFTVQSPTGRMDFLERHHRIHTSTVGGGFQGGGSRDMVLSDQILPEWNRIVILNFQTSPVYHSVSPSGDRERYGFVLWVEETLKGS